MRGGDAIATRPPGDTGHLNVTPLIDIVMVLIIFFLLVGQLAIERKGAVDLPEALTGEPAAVEDTPIPVAVDPDGSLTIDGRTTQPDKLAVVLGVLARQRPGSPIQIRADRSVAFARVRAVLDAAREAGFASVELAAKPATADAEGGTP